MTKRRLARWALVGLGTVLFSTGIAWGCALWAPMTSSRSLSQNEISLILSRGPGNEEFLAITSGIENFGVGWAFISAGDATSRPTPPPNNAQPRPDRNSLTKVKVLPIGPKDKYIQIIRAGWPMSCFHGSRSGLGGSRSRHGVIEPPRVVSQMGVKPLRVLPIYPRWGGLAVNTVFYGAIFWLVIPGPKLLRRVMRQRGGRCTTCGYDMSHHEHGTCPECGAA